MRYAARNGAFFIAKHLGRLSRSTFNLLYPIYYLLRFIFNKDTRDALRIKQAAWIEKKHLYCAPVSSCGIETSDLADRARSLT
jgi:hypothetical protein